MTRGGRQLLISIPGALLVIALGFAAGHLPLAPWGVLAMIASFAGLVALLRHDDVAALRRAQEGHFVRPTASDPQDVDGPASASSR